MTRKYERKNQTPIHYVEVEKKLSTWQYVAAVALLLIAFFIGHAFAMPLDVIDGGCSDCGGGYVEPTPTAVPAISPTPLPYWMRGGTASAGSFGARYLSKGACFYSPSTGIAELGNEEHPTHQFYVSSFAEYMTLCKEYQRAVNHAGAPGAFAVWTPVPNGKRI